MSGCNEVALLCFIHKLIVKKSSGHESIRVSIWTKQLSGWDMGICNTYLTLIMRSSVMHSWPLSGRRYRISPHNSRNKYDLWFIYRHE